MKKILIMFVIGIMAVSLGALAACSTSTEPDESSEIEYVYGTATLTYSEFYSGDVSSTESYDAVSSATNSKYSILTNMVTDYVDETTNADGYNITGVANVNIAVNKAELAAYLEINPSFTEIEGEKPSQYKIATVSNNTISYSSTVFSIAKTITDATAELLTDTTWGDYQINVIDGETAYLRVDRSQEYIINENILGIILETESGLKVGLEALQSIWSAVYELSFNVTEDSTNNSHITSDNIEELSKLVGETVTTIKYIMPSETYVYEFDGIYIKPAYTKSITSTVSSGYSSIILSTSDFSEFENAKLTVTYTVGSGRKAQVYTLLNTDITNGTAEYALNTEEIVALETQTGTYAAEIISDNYADITVGVPASSAQLSALTDLISTANGVLNTEYNATLEAHIEEANDLLNKTNVSSAEIASIYSELTTLIA